MQRVSFTGSVLEPCAGGLAIANVLKRSLNITTLTATDISWDNKGKLADATTKKYWQKYGGHDYVITIPSSN